MINMTIFAWIILGYIFVSWTFRCSSLIGKMIAKGERPNEIYIEINWFRFFFEIAIIVFMILFLIL